MSSKSKPICEDCNDTGEVVVDQQVYAGEPHYASIGRQKCICQINVEDQTPEVE